MAVNIFKVEDKIETLIKNIVLWEKRLKNNILKSFPTLFELWGKYARKLN